jgi:hypothetical protein
MGQKDKWDEDRWRFPRIRCWGGAGGLASLAFESVLVLVLEFEFEWG